MKIDKWKDYDFENNGWSRNHENRSDAFAQFLKDFRSDIKRMAKAKGWRVLPFKGNWFTVSGFLYHEASGRYLYFSVSDVRNCKNAWEAMLLRSARHATDYTGGSNNFIDFSRLEYYLT